MIARPVYLNRIRPFIDKPMVKVLTGLRRSGKSSLLTALAHELKDSGVAESQIVRVNLESFRFAHLKDAEALYGHVSEHLAKGKRTYLLLDEIQEVAGWEKAVNGLLVDADVDIYITGSNSRLLSSELSTYLAGRYVEIHVQTLSFSEFLHFRQVSGSPLLPLYDAFDTYRRLGGFPVLHTAVYDTESAYRIVQDIYSSAILRDTVQRHGIRDIELLERVVRYVFQNIGNSFSAKSVADYFKSQQRKADLNTVYNYLNALEGAFIVQRIPRFDIKGREILKTQEKYFVGDICLVHAAMGFRADSISGILENIVMLELRHRGYKVFIGKSGPREIDFVAERGTERIYLQVTYLLNADTTIEREFAPLLDIQDNHPKYVLTMDERWKEGREGVKCLHLADFLVADTW
jgi:uncharacterized protein